MVNGWKRRDFNAYSNARSNGYRQEHFIVNVAARACFTGLHGRTAQRAEMANQRQGKPNA